MIHATLNRSRSHRPDPGHTALIQVTPSCSRPRYCDPGHNALIQVSIRIPSLNLGHWGNLGEFPVGWQLWLTPSDSSVAVVSHPVASLLLVTWFTSYCRLLNSVTMVILLAGDAPGDISKSRRPELFLVRQETDRWQSQRWEVYGHRFDTRPGGAKVTWKCQGGAGTRR